MIYFILFGDRPHRRELTSEEQVYLGQMNENEEEGNEAGRRGRPQRGGRRGGRGGRDEGEDDSGSYFDWGDDGLFIPRMPERAGDGVGGGFTSDRVLAEDDLPLKVSKLLWRRLRLKARDMDQHVPVAWRRSKALRDGMAAARQRLAEGEGGGEAGGKGGEVDAKAARAEVKRLNAAQTVEAIEAELGRLIVEGKLDQQMAMGVGGGKALDDSRGQRVRRVAGAGGGEGEAAEGESSSSSEDDSSSDEEKGEGEEEADEEDEDEEDEFAHLDDWSRIHAQDLEEAIGDEIPTLDRQEEGFEVFREYAEQLIQAGGVIEYRFTLADQLDREVRLPLPLATKRTLRESLQQDQAAVAPAEQLVADGAAAGPGGEATGDKPPQYDAAKAFAWLALNKNPSIGEIQRKELSAAMAATLKKLQEEPNRVERMRARAQGGGGAGGGVGGGGGKGKGKPAAAAKAKAGGKGK